MKFCCVTPCLNAERYIEEALLSLLTQSIFVDEKNQLFFNIIDGGSTDNTKRIVKKIIDRYSNQSNLYINYIIEPDSGMYDALVKGFRLSPDCDVYSYLTASDYYSPYAFEIVADIFSHNSDIHFLTGRIIGYNEKGHMIYSRLPFNYNKNLFIKGFYGTILPFVQQQSTFWDKLAHREINLSKLRCFKLAGDYFMWSSIIKKFPLYIVNTWLGGFRIHKGQLSSKFFDQYKQEMISISLSPQLLDYIFAYLNKICWHLPDHIKEKISSHILSYDLNELLYRIKKTSR